MTTTQISLQQSLESFTSEWSPHVVTRVNDYDVRVVKIRGEFVWHRHIDTDEFFHVLDGNMVIALRDDCGREDTVTLSPGTVFTVPRGVEHKPSSAHGASILLFEPTGTVNTGELRSAEIPAHIQPTSGHELT